MSKITITLAEYNALMVAAEKFHKLMAAGVDNWEGFECLYDDED